MLTIGPVGSAAWVRVRPSIREAGEAGTRGRLDRLSNRVAEPTGFLYARIGLSRRSNHLRRSVSAASEVITPPARDSAGFYESEDAMRCYLTTSVENTKEIWK